MYRDPSEFRKRFKAYKDGKSVREIYGLPGYKDGTVQYEKDGVQYNINPNVVGAELINVTTPEITVTGRNLTKPYDSAYLFNDKTLNEAIRKRMYNTITPVGYDIGLAFYDFITGTNRRTYDPFREALWAKYLGLDYYRNTDGSLAEVAKAVIPSDYKMKVGNPTYGLIYTLNPDLFKYAPMSNPLHPENIKTIDSRMNKEGKNFVQNVTDAYKDDMYNVYASGLGTFTYGRGKDDIGKYMTFYDDWDLNFLEGGIKKLNLPESVMKYVRGDMLAPFGIGHPFTLADKAYYKNGKLPGYYEGELPTRVGDYNIYPSAIGASELKVTSPEIVVTGTDRRPMYQRYDAENSTYDPDAIRIFTDWAPIIGDVGLGLDAYNAFKNLDYLLAGILGGSMLLPTVIEKPGKHLVRFGLNHFPELTKEIYDISRLYSKNVKDNPRLRKYANEVSDLLSSDKIRNRAFASGDTPNLMELSNISNTPISFVHANRTFNRPIINLFGKEMLSPIPIPTSYAGVYIPDKSIFIKRQNRTPNQIRRTTYHEASHAADNGRFVPAFYDKMKVKDWVSDSIYRYLGLPTEKRARIISILTDAQHNGIDIDNPEEIANFLPGYDNKNYEDLLFYNLGENTGSVFLDTVNTLLKGYKNGKSPIHINPANRGKFNATKKRTGKTTEELTHSKNPLTRKRAIFALNARKWNHK